MAFDIMALQKGRGLVQARSKADGGRAVLKYIDVDDLVPSEDNFYSMSAIDELATLIELSGGVKQPALVAPMGGGKYKIIAGHRRRLASLQLVKQGKETYRKMPCMVDADGQEPGADADELRAIDEAILLIITNSQREKTDWDKVQEATRLRALLDQKRRFEKIPGETRKLIAEQLGTTPSQIGRYDSITKHLNQYFTDLLAKGKIGISLAYDLSTLTEDLQHSAMLFHEKNGTEELKTFLSNWKERVKELKLARTSDGKQAEPKGITMVIADETGPAATSEQPRDKEDAPKVEWTEPPDAGNTGKIVGFPVPPAHQPAQKAPKQKNETMSMQRVAVLLGDLRVYCEEMIGVEYKRAEAWEERADALAVAIAALRAKMEAAR